MPNVFAEFFPIFLKGKYAILSARLFVEKNQSIDFGGWQYWIYGRGSLANLKAELC